MDHVRAPDTRGVVDLGCGSGALLELLIREPQLCRIVGVDSSAQALAAAEARLRSIDGSRDRRLSLHHGCLTEIDDGFARFDAVVMVEAFEHLCPAHISRLERAVFAAIAPMRIVITTPNREYNPVYGLGPGERRHGHHRFEWDRPKFERWACGVADRNGYDVTFEGIGPVHAEFGTPTQMAVFRRVSQRGTRN